MNNCTQASQVIQFPFYYHMTHKSNLMGILQHGILSHADVLSRDDVLATDISDAGAQRRRERQEPVYNRSIHEYAPLYVNPRNPMLFVRRCIQHELVILVISHEVLHESQHVFTDGNAASRETRFSSSIDVVATSLEALYAGYWANCVDGKRRRCAELLVYKKVHPRYIVGAICSNNTLAHEIAMTTNLEAEINPSVFF